MAKMFHPDRYHREEGAQLRRIQVAFTQIAHANETLKTKESRENYNFKVKKELDLREKVRATRESGTESTAEDRTAEHGLESFEKAMEAINEEEFAAAAGHLARAVHYSPQNALYHAYFGHALSYLDRQEHKAETSLQTAVKLDPKNPKIRMMLVEFFVDMKMAKRAVGELQRFLELVPENKEAAKRLAELRPKIEEVQ
jgi:predicted Zn-dependent protease